MDPTLLAVIAIVLILVLSCSSAAIFALWPSSSTTNNNTTNNNNTLGPTAAIQPPPQITNTNTTTTANANANANVTTTTSTGGSGGGSGGSGATVSTTSTYHPDFSTNACALTPDSSGRNTAMSAALATKLGYAVPGPGAAVCGKILTVLNRDTGQTVQVKVLDSRSDQYGLDMQEPAFVSIDTDKKGNFRGFLDSIDVHF